MSNKSSKLIELTEDQFIKLRGDVRAFLETAYVIDDYKAEYCHSYIFFKDANLATCMMTNLGMGCELTLKCLHFKVCSVFPIGHGLVDILTIYLKTVYLTKI